MENKCLSCMFFESDDCMYKETLESIKSSISEGAWEIAINFLLTCIAYEDEENEKIIT